MKGIDHVVPEVEVQVGDRTYKIRCSLGLLARFEKATGSNPFDMAVWSNPTPFKLAAIIWAGAVRENPSLTVDEILEDLSVGQVSQVRDILIGLMSKAMTPADESEKKSGGVEEAETAKPS